MNEFVTHESSASTKIQLADWACVLIAIGYRIATTSFFVSLAAAIAAMAFGSPAFFPRAVVGWVIWGILIATVVCILTGMMVSGVEAEIKPNAGPPGANDGADRPKQSTRSNETTKAEHSTSGAV